MSPAPRSIEFYVDFSSPYSYIASEWIEALAARHGRTVEWQAILLGATFQAAGLKSPIEYPLKREYSLLDFERSARFAGVPFRMPAKFPIPTQNAARVFWWLREGGAAAEAAALDGTTTTTGIPAPAAASTGTVFPDAPATGTASSAAAAAGSASHAPAKGSASPDAASSGSASPDAASSGSASPDASAPSVASPDAGAPGSASPGPSAPGVAAATSALPHQAAPGHSAAAWARHCLRAYFARGVDLSDAGALRSLAADFGLAPGQAEAVWNDPRWKARLKAANDAAVAAGVFGAPFFRVDGEPFWGNDRRAQIEHWLDRGPF